MAKIDDYITEIASQFPNPIVNDGGIDREMTEEEKSTWYRFSAERKIERENEELAIAEAAAKRQALLDKLGITEDEARLLLGGN